MGEGQDERGTETDGDAPGGCGCGCGTPDREQLTGSAPSPGTAGVAARAEAPGGTGPHPIEQAAIPAGTFTMGDSSGDRNRGDGETPRHAVALSAFSIDATTVTNDAFAAFVDATGYVTDAEDLGVSAVFHLAVRARDEDVLGAVPGTPWWLAVRGADWRHPAGPESALEGIGDHPVVQVSWADAAAYAGRRLPTEAEWEYASRGGLASRKHPWGDEEVDDGGWRTNIWQGRLPAVNTVEEGFLTTAPVHSFEPTGSGCGRRSATSGNGAQTCGGPTRTSPTRQSAA